MPIEVDFFDIVLTSSSKLFVDTLNLAEEFQWIFGTSANWDISIWNIFLFIFALTYICIVSKMSEVLFVCFLYLCVTNWHESLVNVCLRV